MASGPFEPDLAAAGLQSTTALAAVTAEHGGEAARHAADLVRDAVHHAEQAREAQLLTTLSDGPAPGTDAATASAADSGPQDGSTDEDRDPEAPRTGQTMGAAPTTLDQGRGSNASEALARYQVGVADAWRIGVAASIDYWRSLLAARTMSDIVALNASAVRRQVDAAAEQGREATKLLQALASPEGGTPPDRTER